MHPSKETTPLIVTAETLNAYPTAEVVGELQLDRDCLVVGGRVALFAPGTTLEDGAVTLPTGETTHIGSDAEWNGGYFKVPSVREMAGADEVYQAVQRCAERVGAVEVALITP